MDFDVNKIAEFFKKQDISEYKNDKGNVNNVEDTLLFEQEDGDWKLNENLKTKEGFVDSLFSNKDKALTKEQLETIYDAVSHLDGEDGMSEEELQQLASFGNDKDKFDSEGNTINEFDIAAFLDSVDDAIADPNCCETDCCPADCSCNDDPPEGIETILKDDERIKTEDAIIEKPVNRSDLPQGWQKNEKGEILDANGKVIGRTETIEADVLNNDGINELVTSFYLFEETEGRKYVEVEPWSPKEGENGSLTDIIKNSYDLEAMEIEPDSPEYEALMKAVMDANPEIYGTEDSGWRKEVGGKGRQNAVLYPGDKVYLPEFTLDAECPCHDDEVPKPTQKPTPEPIPEPTVETTPSEPTVPTEPTVDTTPTEPTVDTTPTEPTVDTTPTEPTVDTTPTEPTVDTTPTEPTCDTNPFPDIPTEEETPTLPENTVPDEPTIDTTPDEPTIDTTPDEPTVDTTPDTPTCDTNPLPDNPIEEETPTLPENTTPNKPTVDTTPDEPPVDTTPDEPPVDTTPDTPPADTTPPSNDDVTPPEVDEPDLGADIDPAGPSTENIPNNPVSSSPADERENNHSSNEYEKAESNNNSTPQVAQPIETNKTGDSSNNINSNIDSSNDKVPEAPSTNNNSSGGGDSNNHSGSDSAPKQESKPAENHEKPAPEQSHDSPPSSNSSCNDVAYKDEYVEEENDLL